MSYQIDQIDKNILQLLQKDARLSNKQVALHLHRSITPIHIRVKRLQDEGYIKRFTAIIDPTKIGRLYAGTGKRTFASCLISLSKIGY